MALGLSRHQQLTKFIGVTLGVENGDLIDRVATGRRLFACRVSRYVSVCNSPIALLTTSGKMSSTLDSVLYNL